MMHSLLRCIVIASALLSNQLTVAYLMRELAVNKSLKATDLQRPNERKARAANSISILNGRCPSICECEHAIAGDGNLRIAVHCNGGSIDGDQFATILKQIPPETAILDLEAPIDRPNHLIWDDNLNRMDNLRELRLVNCRIPAISRTLRSRKLELLDLDGNAVEHISMSIFSAVPSIQTLSLANNRLSKLPTGAFTYLKNLRRLSLAHNNISDISANLLRDLSNLRSLRLDGNPIPVQQLNVLFADLPQLRELELNQCNLSAAMVAELQWDKFERLERLGLAGNAMKEVPQVQTIKRLPSLNSLDLSDNGLTQIPPFIFENTNISHLFLSHNRLGHSPNALVDGSFETEVPLVELDLSYNSFAHFNAPKFLSEAQLASIQTLHLSGNHIDHLDGQMTTNMTALVNLHLANNFITTMPDLLPIEFAQLQLLNLSGNQLTELPEQSADLLPPLRILDISNNRFQSLPVSVVQNFLNRLQQVDLHGNPWDCGCYVEELKRHMLERYTYRRQLHFEQTRCVNTRETHTADTVIYRLNHVTDCALLFGARYGLSQLSELTILFAALIAFALIVSLTIILAYNRIDHVQKKKHNDITQSHSRIALTLSQHLDATSLSSMTDQLTPILAESATSNGAPKMPPPPDRLPYITDF